jgi:hypothetical protein
MKKRHVAQEAENIVRKVKQGELSSTQASERLLGLLQKSETVADLQLTYAARDDLEKLAAGALSL